MKRLNVVATISVLVAVSAIAIASQRNLFLLLETWIRGGEAVVGGRKIVLVGAEYFLPPVTENDVLVSKLRVNLGVIQVSKTSLKKEEWILSMKLECEGLQCSDFILSSPDLQDKAAVEVRFKYATSSSGELIWDTVLLPSSGISIRYMGSLESRRQLEATVKRLAMQLASDQSPRE